MGGVGCDPPSHPTSRWIAGHEEEYKLPTAEAALLAVVPGGGPCTDDADCGGELRGAVLYSSGECCPMCYAAACWARITKVYYASRWSDYADLFDDARIQADMARPPQARQLAPEPLLREEALAVWQEFRQLEGGARY